MELGAIAWEEQPEMVGWFRRIQLMVESEFGGRYAVEDDFQKLMVARAVRRLLVFDHQTKEEAEETIAECTRAVPN